MAIARFQAADDTGRYLSDEDLTIVASLAPATAGLIPADLIAIVQRWRNQVSDIVDEARAEVLQAFPVITEPGGGLYPGL